MITLAELENAADRGPLASLPAGDVARDIREAVGVTATEIAAAVGICEKSWSRYERGVSTRFLSPAVDKRASRVVAHLRELAERLGDPEWAVTPKEDFDEESNDHGNSKP